MEQEKAATVLKQALAAAGHAEAEDLFLLRPLPKLLEEGLHGALGLSKSPRRQAAYALATHPFLQDPALPTRSVELIFAEVNDLLSAEEALLKATAAHQDPLRQDSFYGEFLESIPFYYLRQARHNLTALMEASEAYERLEPAPSPHHLLQDWLQFEVAVEETLPYLPLVAEEVAVVSDRYFLQGWRRQLAKQVVGWHGVLASLVWDREYFGEGPAPLQLPLELLQALCLPAQGYLPAAEAEDHFLLQTWEQELPWR